MGILIDNNDKNLNIICGCCGECSILRFCEYDEDIYKGDIYLPSYNKFNKKEIKKLEKSLILSKFDINMIYDTLGHIVNERDGCSFSIPIMNVKDDIYIEFIKYGEDKNLSFVAVNFYTSYKNYIKEKITYDIILFDEMVNKILKFLKIKFNY